jgi:hypothetical protein
VSPDFYDNTQSSLSPSIHCGSCDRNNEVAKTDFSDHHRRQPTIASHLDVPPKISYVPIWISTHQSTDLVSDRREGAKPNAHAPASQHNPIN